MAKQIIIFIRDNNNDSNKELMNFLHKNLKITTRCGNYIVPKIIHKYQEKEFSKKYSVNELPVSIYNKSSYVGKKKIKELIMSVCKSDNVIREKTQEEHDNEDLRDYHQAIINSGEEDESNNDDIQHRLSRAAIMTKQRETNPTRKNVDHYKDMDTESQEIPPATSDRPDNIETNEDISEVAHNEAGDDFDNMDALLEKIQGANAGDF